MALTCNAFVDLVKRGSQGFALRSLSELTTCRSEIDIGTIRSLLSNLTSIRLLTAFGGAVGAASLAAFLSVLLERYQYGEIARGRSVVEVTRHGLTRLLETALSLDGMSDGRMRLRGHLARTADVEAEIAQLLNLEDAPEYGSVLSLSARNTCREQLSSLAAAGHDLNRYVTLCVLDLLQHGEELPELLPILGNLAERGVLAHWGLMDTSTHRGRTLALSSSSEALGFLVFYTDTPWEPGGVFARLPVTHVATLFDPGSGPETEAWPSSMPEVCAELVRERLMIAQGAAVSSEEGESAGKDAGIAAPRPRSRLTWNRTIGFKLITIISIILIASLATMIVIASGFFRKDVTVRIEENTNTLSQVTALAVGGELDSVISNTEVFLSMVDRFSDVPGGVQNLQTTFFAHSAGIGYVGIPGHVDFYNDALLEGRQLPRADLQRAIAAEQNALTSAASGVASIVNLSPSLKSPLMGIVVPYRSGNAFLPLVIVSVLDSYVETVQSTGITHTFIVNGKGQLVVDPDLTLLAGAIDYSTMPIVAAMLKSPIDNGQMQFSDSHRVRYLGSFKRIGFAGAGVVVTAPAVKAFEAVGDIQRRNLLLTGLVLALSILVVYFFSKTITRPVGRLVAAAQQVGAGSFLVELEPTTRDEIGLLTETFVQMGQGLHERERIKEAFGKFVSKNVAEQALRDEIRLGGETRAATILFSDIRSFTAISEKLLPEEVVEFLNDYMTRMVECVNATHGVVDKFIGDAVMAVWGVPLSHGNDAEHAVNGALLMRQSLIEFNRGRGSVKRPIIRIGCGINSGPVVAGQIGSTERMEYTVIGDPVNLASRIEALNKPFGTDILISSDTYALVSDVFDVIPQLKIKVKGKSEPQRIYAVLGRRDDHHRPKDIRELQRLIGVDPAMLKKQPTEGEEVKYEILDE